MATRYSQSIKTDIQRLDYDAACIICRWIFNSLNTIPNYSKVNFDIHYRLGDISCSTDNFDEFIEKTYGQSPDITSIRISKDISFNISDSFERIGNGIRNFVEISIHSDTIVSLKQVIEELKKQMTMPTTTPDLIIQQPTIEVKVGRDLHMNGSAIGTGNNVTSTKHEITQEVGFWKGVWQNIVSNVIWWLLGAIAVVALIYLGVR